MRRGQTSAFTLVEVITVIVILAVLSSLVVPRLVNWDERRAEAGVGQVADVLSGAARRHLFTTQRLALDFADGRLRVLALRLRDAASFDAGNERWQDDPLTPAVELDGLEVADASSDGRPLDPRRFRVEFPVAEPRPAIVLRLAATRGRGTWTVSLPPTAERADVLPGDARAEDPRIDLDRAGLRDEAW